jgi:hypothetical protein
VSPSISTSATCAPFGHEGVDGVSVAETRISREACRAASSPSPIERSVPAICQRPSRSSMSAGGGLERLGGGLPALLDHPAPGGDHCGAAHEGRARADATDAVGAIRVALNDANFSSIHSEQLRNQLRIGRLKALPHRLSAGKHRDHAFGVDLDIHRLGG